MSESDYERKMSDREMDFWAKYAEKLMVAGIKGSIGEWYVRRAQEFVYQLNERKLRGLDSAYLDAYFQELGRKAELKDCLSRWSLLSF